MLLQRGSLSSGEPSCLLEILGDPGLRERSGRNARDLVALSDGVPHREGAVLPQSASENSQPVPRGAGGHRELLRLPPLSAQDATVPGLLPDEGGTDWLRAAV